MVEEDLTSESLVQRLNQSSRVPSATWRRHHNAVITVVFNCVCISASRIVRSYSCLYLYVLYLEIFLANGCLVKRIHT